MNASAIDDLYYEWYLKIHSKLSQPLGECNLKEFSNITSTLNPQLLIQAFIGLLIYYMTEKTANSCTLICIAVQTKNFTIRLACSQPITMK